MKATVIKAYKDRLTGELNLRGAEVELTKDRAKELVEGGFVEVEAAPEKKATPAAKKAPAKKAAE